MLGEGDGRAEGYSGGVAASRAGAKQPAERRKTWEEEEELPVCISGQEV